MPISGSTRPVGGLLAEGGNKERKGGCPHGLRCLNQGSDLLRRGSPPPPQMGKEHYFCIKTNINIL